MQFQKKIIINRRPNETVPYLTYSDNILPHPIKTWVRQDLMIGTPSIFQNVVIQQSFKHWGKKIVADLVSTTAQLRYRLDC